jgi:hypothetical protein
MPLRIGIATPGSARAISVLKTTGQKGQPDRATKDFQMDIAKPAVGPGTAIFEHAVACTVGKGKRLPGIKPLSSVTFSCYFHNLLRSVVLFIAAGCLHYNRSVGLWNDLLSSGCGARRSNRERPLRRHTRPRHPGKHRSAESG